MSRAEIPAVLGVSRRMVHRRGLLVPLAVAAALVLGTLPWLDGYGMQVMRGAGVLLACAWVAAMDDPAGEVLAASPYPRVVRAGARALVGLLTVLPAWVGAALVVESQASYVPVLGLGAEALSLGLAGIAVAAAFRAWQEQHRPSHFAIATVVMLALVTQVMPRWYALAPAQTWGPPWQALLIRWLAVAILAGGLLGLALADPLHRRDYAAARAKRISSIASQSSAGFG